MISKLWHSDLQNQLLGGALRYPNALVKLALIKLLVKIVRELYVACTTLKTVFGPLSYGIAPLCSADNKTLLTNCSDIQQRWTEHFSSLLNQPCSFDPSIFPELEQWPISSQLAIRHPISPKLLLHSNSCSLAKHLELMASLQKYRPIQVRRSEAC